MISGVPTLRPTPQTVLFFELRDEVWRACEEWTKEIPHPCTTEVVQTVVPQLLVPRLAGANPNPTHSHWKASALQHRCRDTLGPLLSHPKMEGMSREHTPHQSGSAVCPRLPASTLHRERNNAII